MQRLSQLLKDITKERDHARKSLEHLTAALAALTRAKPTGSTRHTSSVLISAAGRRRIAAAQKARWAAWRKQQKNAG